MPKRTKVVELPEAGYNISVQGRHVLVTDAMKDYVIDKIAKIERFANRITEVNVKMDIQKLDHKILLVLKVGHLKITAHATSNDMYASIDKAVDRLQAKLRKYKSRIQDHAAKPLNIVDIKVNVHQQHIDDVDELNEEIDSENRKQLEESFRVHEIVQTETRPLKTLNVGEAIMKMELSDDAFLVYRSEEDQRLKVIYRREDKNFGVIEPE